MAISRAELINKLQNKKNPTTTIMIPSVEGEIPVLFKLLSRQENIAITQQTLLDTKAALAKSNIKANEKDLEDYPMWVTFLQSNIILKAAVEDNGQPIFNSRAEIEQWFSEVEIETVIKQYLYWQRELDPGIYSLTEEEYNNYLDKMVEGFDPSFLLPLMDQKTHVPIQFVNYLIKTIKSLK